MPELSQDEIDALLAGANAGSNNDSNDASSGGGDTEKIDGVLSDMEKDALG